MKIGIIVPGGVDRSGERRVIPTLLALIKRLAARHEVHVFALHQETDACDYELLRARVHCMSAGRSSLKALRLILKENKRYPFDVLHGFWLTPGGLIAAVAGGLTGAGSLIHISGGELVALQDIGFGSQRTVKGRLFSHLAMTLADGLTAASGPMQHLAGKQGFATTRVPLGVDLDEWPPTTPRSRTDSTTRRIIAVGSINPVKDHSTLIRAFARTLETYPDTTLEFVGEDTLGGRVQAECAELAAGGKVIFHGFVTYRKLRALMRGAHLVVVSSRHEAGPLAALEAAVAGVPVVGTNVGHISDWRELGVPAVAAGDWLALAGAIEFIWENPKWALATAQATHRFATKYDADWTAAAFERLYNSI